jgi:hypothetical protein
MMIQVGASEEPKAKRNSTQDSTVVPNRSTNWAQRFFNFEQTGSGAVIVVWSFLLSGAALHIS